MIDWYYILFLAAGIIVYCLDRVANHHSYADYFILSAEFGIQKGTILLWACLFTVWTFTLNFFISFHLGLGFSIMIWILFYFFLYLFLDKFVPSVKSRAANTLTFGFPDFFIQQFSGNGKVAAGILLLLANMDGLFIQPVFAAWLFQLWFDQSVFLFICLLFLFAVILAGFGGMGALTDTVSILLPICGGVLVFLPLFLYMRTGINQVFDTYQHWSILHPLQINNVIFFSVLLLSWGLAKCSTSIFLWRILWTLKAPHYSSSIKLAVAGGGTFSLSLLIYFVYIGSKSPHADWYTSILAISQDQEELIFLLAVCIWLISVVFSVMLSLFSLTSLIKVYWKSSYAETRPPRLIYLFALILAALASVVTVYLYEYGLQIALYYFLFTAYLALPVFIILYKHKRMPAWIAVTVTVLPICSVLFYWLDHSPYTLYGGLIGSWILAVSIYMFNYSEN